jgi:3-oxoacid CoA-transferase
LRWEPGILQQNGETRKFYGKEYLLEEAFEQAELAWIKASIADKLGNVVFRGISWNFKRLMSHDAYVQLVLSLSCSYFIS